MIHYSNVLIAIDFSQSADTVIKSAVEIVEHSEAKSTILHVVDHLPPMGFGEEPLMAPDWLITEKELIKHAEISLANFCQSHDLVDHKQWVCMGAPHHEIVSVADEIEADLIILGSHGHHGVRLLLGSTANGVLHHAHCDVLAIKIKD